MTLENYCNLQGRSLSDVDKVKTKTSVMIDKAADTHMPSSRVRLGLC